MELVVLFIFQLKFVFGIAGSIGLRQGKVLYAVCETGPPV